MLVFLLALLLRATPGRAQCAPGCTDRGNCNQDFRTCICPYGYSGEACEVDALSACRITPESPATCVEPATMNCECRRQCQKFHCLGDVCAPILPPDTRGCYSRDGLPPDKQLSKAPEEGEQGVRYFLGWKPGAPEATSSEDIAKAMRSPHKPFQTVALSQCPEGCNNRGHCLVHWEDPKAKPFCLCHRHMLGGACEKEDTSWCTLGCSGHGKCTDQFCHCKPPYFSIGCSRNRSVPATSHPSPVDFKIYMYDLPTQYQYPSQIMLGGPRPEDGIMIFSAYLMFLEQFLTSPVRTENPSSANLFFVPSHLFTHTGSSADGNEHMHILLNHVRMKYRFWNLTNGKDHFFFAPADRGSCHLEGLAQQAMKVSHFAYYLPNPKSSAMGTVQDRGADGYSCYHPLRDVAAPNHDTRFKAWAPRSNNMTVDDIIKGKSKLLFFFGATLTEDNKPEYSGDSRQQLDRLVQAWQDPDIEYVTKERSPLAKNQTFYEVGMEDYFRHSKYCFTPYGWGWGNRLVQAVLANCVPVIVQEHVIQHFEELLPYETFSVRLNNADLPNLRETLRAISDAQYRRMMEQLVRHRGAFHWYPEFGGQAFDYTIASLRRRYLNLKALYY